MLKILKIFATTKSDDRQTVIGCIFTAPRGMELSTFVERSKSQATAA